MCSCLYVAIVNYWTMHTMFHNSPRNNVSAPLNYCMVSSSQHISDLGEVPGLAEDHASQKQNTARTFAFKAHRCFHLAESYVVMKKWPEAIALFDRASDHVIQAIEQYRVLEHSGVEATKIDKVCTFNFCTSQLFSACCKITINAQSHTVHNSRFQILFHFHITTFPLPSRCSRYQTCIPSSQKSVVRSVRFM